MIVNRRIVIDLLAGGRYDTAHVVQGDTYSRAVELELRQGNMAWEIPEGVSVVVEYIKADDTRGLYNTLPDGAQAWHAEGNILTLMLAPQMLTAKGNVVTQVRLMRESSQLSLFEFNIYVHKKISNAESEDYFNWQRTFIPNTEGAKVGQMLEITDVDDLGRVTGVKAVNLTVPDSSQNATLTFKGAVEATYDGSEPVEVEIPSGGSGEKNVYIINDVTTESIMQYTREITTEELELLNSAKKVHLGMRTPTSDVELKGVTVTLYSNYSYYCTACRDAILGTGNNTVQFAECVLSKEFGIGVLNSAFGVLGVRQTDKSSLSINSLPNALRPIEFKATTTTETGFPVGTEFKLEVFL